MLDEQDLNKESPAAEQHEQAGEQKKEPETAQELAELGNQWESFIERSSLDAKAETATEFVNAGQGVDVSEAEVSRIAEEIGIPQERAANETALDAAVKNAHEEVQAEIAAEPQEPVAETRESTAEQIEVETDRLNANLARLETNVRTNEGRVSNENVWKKIKEAYENGKIKANIIGIAGASAYLLSAMYMGPRTVELAPITQIAMTAAPAAIWGLARAYNRFRAKREFKKAGWKGQNPL